MNRSCPNCRGANVRRSSTPAAEQTWRNHIYSRYRCRECTAQFWVINRKTRMAARMMLAGIVLAIIAVFLMDMVFNFGSAPSKRRSEALQFQKA